MGTTDRPQALLELRVHGVHGTSPQSMLGVTAGDLGQVAGDGLTGVYRTRDGTVPLRTLPPHVVVEAYSWGALTSSAAGLLGWVRRAAWLALLPFALMNLASWARPELDWRTRPAGADREGAQRDAVLGARLVRLAALLVTVLLVLTPLTIGADLVAWQCYRGGTAGCPVLPSWVDLLAGDRLDEPGQRLAIGTVPALLTLLGLWLLSRQSLDRYERVEEPESVTEGARDHADEGLPVLRHPDLWRGRARTGRLQRLHLSVALTMVVVYTGLPLMRGEGVIPDGRGLLALVDLAAVAVGVAAVVQALAVRPGDVEHHDPAAPATPPPDPWPARLVLASTGLTAVHLGLLLLTDLGTVAEPAGLAGRNLWYLALFVLVTGLHVALFLTGRTGPRLAVGLGALTVALLTGSSFYLAERSALWPDAGAWLCLAGVAVGGVALGVWHYRQPQGAAAWRGSGSSVLLTLALWVALLFTTAAVTATADWLNGDEHTVADLGTAISSLDAGVTGPWTAGGDVAVRGGVLVVDRAHGRVELRSGDLEVGTLSSESDGVVTDVGSRALHDSEVALPADLARLPWTDTCVVAVRPKAPPPPRGCAEGDPTFGVSGSVLPPEGRVLTVGSAGKVRVTVTEPFQRPLALPQVLVWAPPLQLLWVLAVGALALLALRRLRGRVGPLLEHGVADEIAPGDRDACARARLRAAYVHRAERLLDVTGLVSAVLAVSLIVGAETGRPPWELVDTGAVADMLRLLATLGLWSAVGASALIVLAASRMRTSEKARKGLGIIWDLTTFWPRVAHPFAPPCYAERVVPELLTRAKWALDAPDRTLLVLSGHSQGSTLVVAAASRLGAAQLGRVRIVTYGSQIRAWYGRIFPGVFGADAIGYRPTTGTARFGEPGTDLPAPVPEGAREAPPGSLLARLGDPGHWVNLFRRSDPLGFRVFGDDDAGRDLYVAEVPPAAQGDPGPYVMTHSGYPHTARYRSALQRWEAELGPASSSPCTVERVEFLPEP